MNAIMRFGLKDISSLQNMCYQTLHFLPRGARLPRKLPIVVLFMTSLQARAILTHNSGLIHL